MTCEADLKTFPISKVIEATGVGRDALGAWIRRDLLIVSAAPAKGQARMFDRDDVIHIGMIHQLTQLDIAVPQAVAIAYRHQANLQNEPNACSPLAAPLLVATSDDSGAYGVRAALFPRSSSYLEMRVGVGAAPCDAILILDLDPLISKIDAVLDGEE